MFDNNQENGPAAAPPENLPTEPADMFGSLDEGVKAAEVPNALKSGLLKKKEELVDRKPAPLSTFTPTETLPAFDKVKKSPNIGKIIFAVFAMVVFGSLAYGGWWVYGTFFKTSKLPVVEDGTVPEPQAQPEPQNQPQPVTSSATGNQSSNILFGDNDTDSDGLSDAEENELKTDLNLPDTYKDKLSDGDEVKIWFTDPLKLDSDGDTYSDGSEILNGYNPLGAGKYENPALPMVRFVTTSSGDSSVFSYESFEIKN